jgi:hypothetical protein
MAWTSRRTDTMPPAGGLISETGPQHRDRVINSQRIGQQRCQYRPGLGGKLIW